MSMENSCDNGYKGMCCCNCKHQIVLHKHPWNKDFGKGSITEQCGYVCIEPTIHQVNGIYFDQPHGMCECHESKTPNP